MDEESCKKLDKLVIDGYSLYESCSACPEQYEVFKDGKQVAYFRLRHGMFRAVVPDVGGKQVYSSSPMGDGSFFDEERTVELRKAIKEVDEHYRREKWTETK